jgi:hypothetical protein
MEIGNNVFMATKGRRRYLSRWPPQTLITVLAPERTAAALNDPDIFKISLHWP